MKLTELYYAGSHGMDIKGPAQGSKYKEVSFFFYSVESVDVNKPLIFFYFRIFLIYFSFPIVIMKITG